MPYASLTKSKAFTWLAVAFGALVVGALDHVTGADVHVTSFYFVPLAFAGWRLGRSGAAVASTLSAIVWFVAQYTTGVTFAPYVWIANFFTQFTAFLAVSILVSMLAASLQRERALNRTDHLTGLKNRLGFIEHATAALSLCNRHGRPVALAYIDLDNFKDVNDSLGHARGDDLLRTCGRLIGESLRASDIAARLGGDEFAVFLPEASADSASTLIERVRDSLATSDDVRSSGVTASIGVIVDEAAKYEFADLLKFADAEMYAAKREGKNQVVVRCARGD